MGKIVGVGHRPKTKAVDTTAFETEIEKLTAKVTELEGVNAIFGEDLKKVNEENATLTESNEKLTAKVTELEKTSKKGDK